MGIVDFVLHFDKHLLEFVARYGTWVYAILFTIVFAETGFVVTPFLPGDSLLFAAGALCATGSGFESATRVGRNCCAASRGISVRSWLRWNEVRRSLKSRERASE